MFNNNLIAVDLFPLVFVFQVMVYNEIASAVSNVVSCSKFMVSCGSLVINTSVSVANNDETSISDLQETFTMELKTIMQSSEISMFYLKRLPHQCSCDELTCNDMLNVTYRLDEAV